MSYEYFKIKPCVKEQFTTDYEKSIWSSYKDNGYNCISDPNNHIYL